jgi:DMSO reductase iron-sulfur subunit
MFPVKTQYGFHFNADRCIGCHSCEAACSEKNGLPPHIAWRRVGYLEGGEYPHMTRLYYSMACNHCENPVCLRGCPTGAYVKYEATGAVVQDSDICFGCRYCTWVCPYGAPVYNPEAGSVSKCNFCVDRLAVGLKPACVSACLGHALEFGEVSRLGEEHAQSLHDLPGFPTSAITQPNIRFERREPLPKELTRVDGEPLVYLSDGIVHSKEVRSQKSEVRSGLSLIWRLHSEETPLVFFTLIVQAAVGALATLWGSALFIPATPVFFSAQASLLWGLTGIVAVAMGLSTAHLGKPRYCYRALYNLRYSWVSREILAVGGFFAFLAASAMGSLFGEAWLGVPPAAGWGLQTAALLMGLAGIYAMARIYRIPARPFWDHSHTLVSFFVSALVLGPMMAFLILKSAGAQVGALAAVAGIALAASLAIQIASEHLHHRRLALSEGEGRASYDLLLGRYGGFFRLRGGLRGAAIVLGIGTALSASQVMAVSAFLCAAAAELFGRALFYLAVVPMTMPGAFFLRSRQFETYARETGLANDPLVGVWNGRH